MRKCGRQKRKVMMIVTSQENTEKGAKNFEDDQSLPLFSHIIKQSYWIIDKRKLINKSIHNSIKCFIFKFSTKISHLMGNLSKHNYTRMIILDMRCGLCRLISIKFNKSLGEKLTEGYIAFFCLF